VCMDMCAIYINILLYYTFAGTWRVRRSTRCCRYNARLFVSLLDLLSHTSITVCRYMAGQKEYEVELQFTSGITGYPDRVKTGWEENKDGEEPVPGSTTDMASQTTKSQL